MSPTVHLVLATVLTAGRLGLALVAMVDLLVAVILWLPPDAPFPREWADQAIAAAAGYILASVLFWVLGRIPVKRPPGDPPSTT